MTDRELLELAAKAAGVEILDAGLVINGRYTVRKDGCGLDYWNPLTDDGDAMRLAVKLNMRLVVHNGAAWANDKEEPHSFHADDKNAATRRAIVRAAAEIGRAM